MSAPFAKALAAAPAYAPEEPQPLMRETPPGAAYPVAALGPLRPAAEAIADMTQAPAAIAAQAVLGVAALAAQALGDAETLEGRAPASLYLLTIAQSGERKSSCDRRAMIPVEAFERELAEAHRNEATAHRNRLELWQAQRNAILKATKGKRGAAQGEQAAQAELAALGPEPEGPLSPCVIATEPTFEGLAKNFTHFRPALGIFSDEGGGFIGGHAMNSDNRIKTVSGLSDLWGGKPINRTRAGDGVMTFRGRRLSAHLMAQPVVAAGLLSDPIANGQGFLGRFLITEPPSAIGTRLRTGWSAESDRALAAFSARIGDLLRRPLPLREGTRAELDPPLVALGPEARALLQDFAHHVERAQARGGPLEGTRPFGSKAAEHAARLAAVLTLYADPAASGVTAETMANAVELAGFYIGEAQRLADAATISAETMDAERLRRWLVDAWPEDFISASDAAQRGPFKETVKNRKLLGLLAGEGWVTLAQDGAEVLGARRREVWCVWRGAGR